MNKVFKLIIALTLFIFPSAVHAKDNNNAKPYKNVKLQTKNGDIVYKVLDVVPSLNNSTERINTNALISLGYTGKGYTVAVVDTGVDFSHPFLTGRKAGEACFTANNSCPNGTNQMIGDGAARPTHWHGTHVAGIIAGSNTTMHGVAPGAKILGINIFEEDGSANEQSIIDALEYVNSVRSTYNIVSVNLSLGTSRQWTGLCDAVSPELTTIIHTLINNKVAVVAAAGNSFSYGMANPACISGVTSVAASYSTSDDITEFSNISNYTTFAAPGYQINSSVAGGSYRQASGTSMSTPHVAGAFALYNSFKPGLSVQQQVANLQANCPKAYDAPTKISVCRLDFTFVASGEVVSPPDTTVPSPPDTTIPPPSTTVPSPVVTIPPVTTVPPVYEMMIGKPRLNFVQQYSNGTLSINYTDPIYGKQLISNYILTCGANVYTFAPVMQYTNHVYSVLNAPNNITSCYLQPLSFSNILGPATQSVFVYKV